MNQLDKLRVHQIPDALYSAEADVAYGQPVDDPAKNLAFAREMAELSDKMILEVMALFDDDGVELDFSEDSLEDLDLLANQLWGDPVEDEEALEAIVANWGAYLGVMIQESLGGAWRFRQDLDHASIHFPRVQLEAFPLHVVRKRFQLGPGHVSLGAFYEDLVAKLTAD